MTHAPAVLDLQLRTVLKQRSAIVTAFHLLYSLCNTCATAICSRSLSAASRTPANRCTLVQHVAPPPYPLFCSPRRSRTGSPASTTCTARSRLPLSSTRAVCPTYRRSCKVIQDAPPSPSPPPCSPEAVTVWPADVEECISGETLPSAELDLDVSAFGRVCCAMLDIPVHQSLKESLHELFTLYALAPPPPSHRPKLRVQVSHTRESHVTQVPRVQNNPGFSRGGRRRVWRAALVIGSMFLTISSTPCRL